MQNLKILLFLLGFHLSYVDGEGAVAEFCKVYENLSWVATERFFCHLNTADRLGAMNCVKNETKIADKLLSQSYCFRGYHGEQEREDFFIDNKPLREKVDGVCDDECKAKRQKLLSDLDATEVKVMNASRKAQKLLERTAKVMSLYKNGLVQFREQSNDREGIKKGLLTKIQNSKLDPATKKKMIASTEESMNYDDPRWTTSYATIIENTNKEMNMLEKKRIDAAANGNVIKAHFKNTKRYIKGMSNMQKLDKASKAVTNIASAVPKLTSGEPEQIISGALDIVTAVSNFLPPPASVITGTITGIFNSLFGIGGPTVNQMIMDEFAAQNKFIKTSFKKLHKKLDENFDKQLETLKKEQLKDAALEMKNNQAAFQQLIREQLTFLKPLFDDNIDSDTMLYIGTQINMFQGSVQATKSTLFLEENCKTEDPDIINICMAIFYQYVSTERIRDIVLAKLMSVYRRASIDSRIIEGQLEVQSERRRKSKFFIEDWLNIPNKEDLYVFACLSQGRMPANSTALAIPENAIAAIKDYAHHLDVVIRPPSGINCNGKADPPPPKPAECSCSDYVDHGYGKCTKGHSSLYGGSVFCYVNQPSNCKDLKKLGHLKWQLASAEPCKKISGSSGIVTRIPGSGICLDSETCETRRNCPFIQGKLHDQIITERRNDMAQYDKIEKELLSIKCKPNERFWDSEGFCCPKSGAVLNTNFGQTLCLTSETCEPTKKCPLIQKKIQDLQSGILDHEKQKMKWQLDSLMCNEGAYCCPKPSMELKNVNPRGGYMKMKGGRFCEKPITTEEECEKASKVLDLLPVTSFNQRGEFPGCFHGGNEQVYFNKSPNPMTAPTANERYLEAICKD